jgi:hypothetical protein
MDGIELGITARRKNASTYSNIVKALVPIAQRLAAIYGENGITASNVRWHGINRGIIQENTPTHYLSSVMKQAGLRSSRITRPCKLFASTKGRRQIVYFAADTPYAD